MATIPYIKASKLQSDEATSDPKLRALAKKVVTRQWISVALQAILFAPFLKAVFPLHQWRTAMSPVEYGTFLLIWFVSNDFLFTVVSKTKIKKHQSVTSENSTEINQKALLLTYILLSFPSSSHPKPMCCCCLLFGGPLGIC